MQAELSLELTATSKSEMPKSDMDSKSFLQHSPAWKHAGITRARRQRPAPQLLLLSYVPTACPQGGRRGRASAGSSPSVAGRIFPHGYPMAKQMHGAALSSSHLQKELLVGAILSRALITLVFNVCLCVLEQ